MTEPQYESPGPDHPNAIASAFWIIVIIAALALIALALTDTALR